ncbi:putative ABC transporter periplasmic substrate-binding protein [Pseudomonas aeruginosa]|nr:putative ABC transporter periplasmic substrate-binding protein [Pseudomonas aeruginosa]
MNLKPHCLALALACAGLAGPLPALAATPAAAQSAQVTVLASLPVTHALAERLLRDTEVKLQRVAPANLPASRQASFFAGRGAGGLAKAAGQADAVIDLRSIWSDDPLYPLARRSNIRIVEIDAARPVDGALPGIALRPGSDLHAYPWLNPTNLGRMARCSCQRPGTPGARRRSDHPGQPGDAEEAIAEATASNETRLAKADNLSVISLSERLGYLLAGLNLDPLDVEIQADDGWTETNIQAFAEELKSEDIAPGPAPSPTTQAPRRCHRRQRRTPGSGGHRGRRTRWPAWKAT